MWVGENNGFLYDIRNIWRCRKSSPTFTDFCQAAVGVWIGFATSNSVSN